MRSILRMKPLFLIFLSFLAGCASYNSQPLGNPCVVEGPQSKNEVVVMAKAFDQKDCKKFLDRNVLSKGFQPIQIYIRNPSAKSYEFSPARVTLPCATAEEVAVKVHTSTVGRAAGYGVAAVLTSGLFVIPAIVDGIQSSHANASLDQDFDLKTAKEEIILPYSQMNSLLFIPVEELKPSFQITLIDVETKTPSLFHVTIR